MLEFCCYNQLTISNTYSRSFPSADVGSDHQLLMCTLRLKLKKESKRKVSNRKHDTNKLLIPDICAAYQEELKQRFRDKPISSMTLDQKAERYSQIIKEAADTVLGFQCFRKKPWISDATLELTDQRREVKKVIASRSDLKPTYKLQCIHLPDSCKYCKGL